MEEKFNCMKLPETETAIPIHLVILDIITYTNK